ncbi:MAG: DUF1292 domain-containing protein [Clostridia bacterium]|nr:DUF1292 domain-containing protein [Clostridia bacterium]
MINLDENTFTVINDEGKEVVCDILFTFDYADTEKSYIVYTDNSKDETNGQVQVFASVLYETNDGNHMLLPIQSETEWVVIETILEELQTSIREQEGGELNES